MKFGTRIFTIMLCMIYAMQIHALSLNEALIKVHEKNIALRSAMQDKKIAEIIRAKAFSSFLPTVNSSLQHQNYYDNNTNDALISLNISENLSLQQISQFKNAKQRAHLANLQFSANTQEIFLETISLYMNILSLHSMLEVNEKRINILEKSLHAAEIRFDMGNSTVVDVENIKLKLNLAKTENLQIKNNLEITELQYENLMSNENDLHRFYFNKNEYENKKEDFTMPNSNDFIELPHPETKIANLKLQSMIKNYEISNTMVESSEAAFFPTFGAQLTKNHISHDKYGTLATRNRAATEDSTSFTVHISLNLLHQGGLDLLNLRESKANRQKAKYDLLDYKLKLHAENKNYWSNLELALAKQQYMEAAIESAKITLKGIEKEYEMGTKNILDLLSAQQDLFNAENDFIVAKKDYVIAHYNLVAQANNLTIENIRKAAENI